VKWPDACHDIHAHIQVHPPSVFTSAVSLFCQIADRSHERFSTLLFHAPLLTDWRLESWKPMASEADSSSKQWARNGPLTKDHRG
jgi:hypothetical protein